MVLLWLGSEIADEVLAHYSGRQGAAKLSEEQQRIARDQNMDLRSKATAIAALNPTLTLKRKIGLFSRQSVPETLDNQLLLSGKP